MPESQGGVQALESVLTAQGIPVSATAADGTTATLPPGVNESTLQALKDSGFELTSPTAAQGTAAVESTPETETPASATPETPSSDTLEIGDSKGLTEETFKQYATEYLKDGKLGDESRAAIMEKHSIDSAMLDLVLQGVAAQQAVGSNAAKEQAFATAGIDQAGFDAAALWSRENESQAAIDVRDRMLTSTDTAVRDMAIADLVRSANSSGEPVHERGGAAVGGGQAKADFSTTLSQAMSNPLYNKQNAAGDRFREEVYAQLQKAPR